MAFRFKSGYQDVYIHCKLTVCRSDDQESKCEKGCKKGENESRKKRDVTEGYPVDVYVGPIKLKEDEGKGNYRKNSEHYIYLNFHSVDKSMYGTVFEFKI